MNVAGNFSRVLFLFCFVLVAAARWNDVDVIVNPTTALPSKWRGASASHTLRGANFCYCCHADQKKTYREKNPNGNLLKSLCVITSEGLTLC